MTYYTDSTGVICPYHKCREYSSNNNIKYYSGIDLVNAAFESTLIILSNMYDSDELNLKGIKPDWNGHFYCDYSSTYEGYIKKIKNNNLKIIQEEINKNTIINNSVIGNILIDHQISINKLKIQNSKQTKQIQRLYFIVIILLLIIVSFNVYILVFYEK